MSQKWVANVSTLDQRTNATLKQADYFGIDPPSGVGMGLAVKQVDMRYVQQPLGASGPSRLASGAYTVTSGDVSGTQSSVPTGFTVSVTSFIVQILRSGATLTGDAKVSVSGLNLVVQSGTSVYVLTAGDVVNWIATGT